MSDTTAIPEQGEVNLGLYWKAWVVLLAITLVMVFVESPTLIVIGICAKATIITAWFMHLKYEKLDFILYVVLSIVICSAFLFGLIYPDGAAM